MHFVQNKVTL